MASVGIMLDNVRARLGEVSAQRPSEKQVSLNLSTQLQTFINQANLSAKPWAIDTVSFTTQPGIEDFPVQASNFGKPLRVSTVYNTNPAHIVRDIPFFELVDTNFDWNLPRNFGNLYYNADGSPNTMLRVAFYRRGGVDQVYMRVVPIPQQTAQYTILYQIGEYGSTTPLEEIPVLPQFHALVEVRTAIALLPLCEWTDNADENRARRRELALSLSLDANRLESDFQQYLRTVTVSRGLSFAPPAFSVD